MLKLTFIATLCLTGFLAADDQPANATNVLLWPNDEALNSPDGMGTIEEREKLCPLTANIKTPHLKVFPGPESNQPTPAIILVPGGGYGSVVHGKHLDTQAWLTTKGVRVFMLMYRCPAKKTDEGPFQDIQEAIRIVRSRAKEWNIDPKRVGILGSSAGGHLCVRASLAEGDDSAKPDFAVLLYPAYLVKRNTKELEESLKVTKAAPPTLIFAGRGDRGYFHNSPIYEEALKAAGVPVQSQYFNKAGHGFSLRSPESVSAWPETMEAWLKELKVLP